MRIKFLLFSLCFVSTIAHAQWTAVKTPITSNIECIVFKDSLQGFVTTNTEELYRTMDGGATWTKVNGVPGGMAISFSDKNNGYMAGISTAQRTTNGGSSWTKLTPPSMPFVGVAAINANTAICVGSIDAVVKTTDAGAHWLVQQLNETGIMSDISYVGSGIAYICDNGNIYKSTDTGANWNNVYSTSASLYGLCFVNTSTGYAVGSKGTILKTSNGGRTWSFVQRGFENLKKVKFYNETRGIAVGDKGVIFITSDGKNWEPINSGTKRNLTGIALLGNSKAFVVGDSGTILVNDNIYSRIGANETEKSKVVVFPNPFSSDLYISGLDYSLNTRIELHDVSGRLVETEMLNGLETTIRISLENLANGLYTYSISTPSRVIASGKVVKN